MKRRPSSASLVRKRPAGSVPARATPLQVSLPPAEAHQHHDPSLRESPSANSEMDLTSSAPASGAVVQRAETDLGNASTILFDKIKDQLRALGHWPTASCGYEYSLRLQICRFIEDGVFSKAQTAEIEAMKKTMEAVGGTKIMQQIHDLENMPKASGEHQQRAVQTNTISPSPKQEAEALTGAHQASPAEPLEAAPEIPQPLDPLDASTATSLQKRPAAACAQKDSRSLAEALSSLGHWPKRKLHPQGPEEIKENNLAIRLHKAQKNGIDQGTHLASVLNNLPPDIRPNVEDELVNQIRALGHVPKRKRNPAGEEQSAENNMARRLSRLRRKGETTQTHDVFHLASNTDTSQTDDAAQVGT